MNNRINLYLQKSAGEDERGGGLGLVGNVAAAGIAGGAGYMGYQKFKPELHAAYHDIVGTAKSQATKGIMGYAKKGLMGAGVIAGGLMLGTHGPGTIMHAAGRAKEWGKSLFKGEATAAKKVAGNPISYMAPKPPTKTASAFKPIHYRYY